MSFFSFTIRLTFTLMSTLKFSKILSPLNSALIMAFCSFTPLAQAGLFAEPWVAYSSGAGKTTTTSNSTFASNTSTVSGGEIGLRLGAKAGWLWLAVDPHYFSGTTQTTTSTNSTTSKETTQTSVYGLVGLDLPGRLRIYGGGSLVSELKTKSTSTQTDSMNGYKAGLGLRITPRFGAQLEYRSEKSAKITDSQTGSIDVAANFSTVEKNRGVFSLSYLF